MASTSRTAFDLYLQLTQQGVPPPEAYRQAFPQGIYTGRKTPEQQAKEQAKEQQKAGYAKLGGALVGALAVKGAGQALSGERVFGETRDNLGRLIGLDKTVAAPTGVAATRVTAPSTPTGLSAARVTELPPGSTTTPTGEILAEGGKVVDPKTGMTTGDWVQGALGVIQVIQGAKEFKGDKIAGALGTTAGLANIGTQVAKQFNLGGTDTLGDVAGAAGAAYGAYGLGKMALKSGDYSKSDKGSLALQGAGYGASIGSYIPGVGTAIGAIVGGTYGFLSGFTGSGKGLRQQVRDKWREAMLENNVGFFDENYQGKLPDGSTFDWGKDKFTFGKKEGDIDLENPVVGKAAAYGNVMAALQGATDRKPREAIATQFLAAGTTNAKDDQEKMRGNFKYFFSKLGMDAKGAQSQLDAMYNDGKLNENEYKVYSNDLKEMLA